MNAFAAPCLVMINMRKMTKDANMKFAAIVAGYKVDC